jgi:hypothetical protein
MKPIYSIVIGAVAGFLTRPCCVLSGALSVAGVSSAGLAHAAATHRAAFLSASGILLASSVWLTFRRPGGWFIKTLTAVATVSAFVTSIGVF